MEKCYLCGKSLSAENSSKEHIFLNAIGGRLKSKKLICRTCNANFGEKIDFTLSEQLKPFANLFNINRGDGEIAKPFDAKGVTSGEKYSIKAGGNPTIKKPVEVNKTSEGKVFIIQTNNKNEAIEILDGLKKRYSQIDTEMVLDSAVYKYVTDKLCVSSTFGGADAFRSLCKTAVNFYILKNGDVSNINHLIPFLKGESDNDCVFFHYSEHEIIERQQHEILHSIIISGDKTEKILYAYIELFSFYKVIVLLNDNYNGENFSSSYFYDILDCDKIQKCFSLCLKKKEILKLLRDRILPSIEIRKEIEKILVIWREKASEDFLVQSIDNAIDSSLYPEETEMYNEFLKEFLKEITPWVIANFNNVDSI